MGSKHLWNIVGKYIDIRYFSDQCIEINDWNIGTSHYTTTLIINFSIGSTNIQEHSHTGSLLER